MNKLVIGVVALLGATLAQAETAEETYNKVCVTCHAAGVANAPKKGDKAAWEARLKERGGMDALVASAKTGRNAMPPMGTCMTCTDEQMKALVEYMSK